MKNIVGRKATIVILIFLLLIFVSISYVLSYLITTIGSFIFLSLLIWFFTKSLTNMLVFPGSYILWLRMIEANFSSELSSQAVNKLSKLIVFLESLSITSSTLIFPETTLKLIQKLLTTLYENYDKMQT